MSISKFLNKKGQSFLLFTVLIITVLFFTGCENLSISNVETPEFQESPERPTYQIISVIDTYALWPGEKGISAEESDFSLNIGTISSVKWDMDYLDGIDFDNPDATGLNPDFEYSTGGYYTAIVQVESEYGIFNYMADIPVAYNFDVGSPVVGWSCGLNIMPDGRVILLLGSELQIQDSVSSDSFTTYFDFPECDPAFILPKSDNNTILVGAGASSGGSIWEVKLSDYAGTVLEPTVAQAKFQYSHYSGVLLNDDTLLVECGDFTDSWISVIDMSESVWTNTLILQKNGTLSAGIWLDEYSNLYTKTNSVSYAPAAYPNTNGSITRFSSSKVATAITSGIPLTLAEGTMIMDNNTYSQNTIVGDELGNLFVSGNYFGVGPGYFSLADAPSTSDDLPLVFHASTGADDPGYEGTISLGSSGGGFIAWTSTQDWTNYSAIIVPVKPFH